MIDEDKVKNLSDNELVKLTIKNQDNFLFIINRYKLKLFNYILKITSISREDAEDVLQDVFLKVYLNLNDYDNDYKFSSWLYSITRNQVISNFRKLKSRVEGNKTNINDEELNKIAVNINLEEKIDKEILQKNIQNVLNNLKYKYKEIIILKFMEEKSYQEISDIIKKPVGTVGSLLNKAKKEFKKELNNNLL